jgi:hypothetical protein
MNKKFIELQPGGYFVCSRPDLAPPVPSAQTPLHLRHYYHQVVEFSHAALPLGWTSSPRIWTSVMSVVGAALRRHGMRTLLYVDDLLIVCSSFEEASRARQIIEDTCPFATILWRFLALPDTHTCANTSCYNVYSRIICSLSGLLAAYPLFYIIVFLSKYRTKLSKPPEYPLDIPRIP